MPHLLLEVGCEELPATFVARAYADLADRLLGGLKEAGLASDEASVRSLGTPRRLIVGIDGVLDRQPDVVKEMRGPAIKAAFDDAGNPTNALLGFCRGQGVDVANVRNDGQYVWVDKHIAGRPAAEVLPELMEAAIRGLTFPKTMRWGSTRMRFARPIRWILAAFDGDAVSFDIEGVRSGLESAGHRFYAPAPFVAADFDSLVAGLRDRYVEPDPNVRRQMIVAQTTKVAPGSAEMQVDLVDENVFLTEWPTAISGSFPESLLAMPEPVLVTAMAKHEKMFPVRDDAGRLLPNFVFIRNGGEDETVRRGCEWVLNARFNDAKFFFEEDRVHTMDDFLDRTEKVVFQEKLATVRQRASRLESLAREIAVACGASSEEQEWAAQAGKYAKADLSTGLVSELASLQGIIGGEYARREGMPDAVCTAIARQYDPFAFDLTPTTFHLAIADQLDKLAGYLGLGLAPSGSSDPFALRRAVTILIELAWRWQGGLLPFDALLDFALDRYEAQGLQLDRAAAHATLADIFEGRYQALRDDVRFDILQAAMRADSPSELTHPRGVAQRIEWLQAVASDKSLVETATRPINLVASATKKGLEISERVDGEMLGSDAGKALLTMLEGLPDEPVAAARQLQPAINAYIDGVMIMANDESERAARLGLMAKVSERLLKVGDWTKLVVEG